MQPDKLKNLSLDLLSDGYSLKLTVTGNSMFPYLLSDEVVKVIPFDEKKLKKGDIIVFKNPTGLIAHRLIGFNKKAHTYTTKGDFCMRKDPLLRKDQIVGKIVAVFRKEKEFNLEKSYIHLINAILSHLTFVLPYFIKVLRKLGLVKIPSEYFHN